jgi:mannose-1-phosphate guanylyltransferase
MITKAMLLAAGLGLRLRPLTESIPKCMVPVCGKPVLEYNVEWLRQYGVREIIINLHYLPEMVMDHFGDGDRWGVRITYSLERESLGTAGGVKNMAWFFDEEPFFVWYGDNLSTCNLDRLQRFHTTTGGLATIALHHRDDVAQSGIVALDESGRIVRFLEKPRPDQVFSHWVSAGIYVMEPAVLDFIPQGVSDFGCDVFPAVLAAGRPLYGYPHSPDERLWWIDTPEDLRKVEEGGWMREEGVL